MFLELIWRYIVQKISINIKLCCVLKNLFLGNLKLFFPQFYA